MNNNTSLLHLNRYPGQSILLEYGNTLELMYCKCKWNSGFNKSVHSFQIYVNNELKYQHDFIGNDDNPIFFQDDGIEFEFRVNSGKNNNRLDQRKGIDQRTITIICPRFVHIRRKEIPLQEKSA